MSGLVTGAGGGGGKGCFLGHTLVATPEGVRRLDELRSGDLVRSFDHRGQLHDARVLAVHVHENEPVVRYTLWGGGTLDATPNHWVLNQYNAFVAIGTLGDDDCLVDENGHLRPIIGREDRGLGTVYNLTVEGHHTFIAGGIRVHNAGLGMGLTGAGGGGGKGSKGGGGSATEAADNLESRQYVKVLDLLSEGEIQGLVNGAQSIYLDNTPLQNPNGTFNFKNTIYVTRNGTQSQSYLEGFSEVEDIKAVGIEVKEQFPITRTISDTFVDAAKLTLTIPALQILDDSGNIKGSSVRIQIQVQYNGGGFSTVIDDTITGRTGDPYQRDYLVRLTGSKPVDIRFVRVTPDSTSSKLQNATTWTSYTEITYAKLRYPNSALVGMRLDAEQFSSVPTRSYRIRGIKVHIPNNATVDQTTGRLIYSGLWNGSFAAAQWCSDPAWILWDLLTSTRYGFGDHINSTQLDRWAFFQASQYCSELVPNGFGGVEPRFSCNVNIQTPSEAYQLVNELCSVMRVMPFWSTGSLTIAQDKPQDPSCLFTLANVTEDGFSYSGSSLKTRPTVAVVGYYDMQQRDTAYEVVEDRAAIARWGVVTAEIDALTCTSRGQAARLGEWLLYSEQFEREVISFTTSLENGVVVRPGQIIEVSDPVRAGQRRGGRLSSVTSASVVVLDDAADLPTGGTLSVVLPDGTVENRAITGRSGTTVTVNPAFSRAPNPNTIWIHQSNDLQTSLWRVLGVQEQDAINYTVTAITYNPSKFAYIERDRPLQQRDVTNLNEVPPTPTNLRGEEAFYEFGGRALTKLVLSWTSVPGIKRYKVRWRENPGNWLSATVDSNGFEILDTSPGQYQVEVSSLNAGLFASAPATLTFNVRGKSVPPEDVTAVSLVPIDSSSAIISWALAPDLDVRIGGKVLIRHTVDLQNPEWNKAQEIVPSAAGSETQKLVPLLEGSYMLKFEDDTGNRSINATTARSDLPTPQPRILVKRFAEDQESPPFTGTPSNMEYDADLDALILSTDPESGLIYTEGQYEFGEHYDLGAVFDVNIRRRLVTRSLVIDALWDDRIELIDTWDDIDGEFADSVMARTYVRHTNDNPAASPTWSEWREFANAIVRGRAFQFKLVAMTADTIENILVDELGVDMELQQHVDRGGPIFSTGADFVVTFPTPYVEPPSVGITGYNLLSTDTFEIGTVSRSNFLLTFRNSSGDPVSRQFTYTAVGFGREIT